MAITLLLGCFLVSHTVSNGMQHKVIKGDGEGYYAYLPAIFIYHDLSFGFKEEYQSKHYGFAVKQKNFQNLVGHKSVNKYFPGVAVLWLPFFLLAHALALLFGLEADGYSHIYQLAIAFANLFYLWAGARILKKHLQESGISQGIATAAVVVVLLGTNIFFYSVYDSSLTHIPNFFLVAAFAYGVLKFSRSALTNYLLFASVAYGLLLISRPQDGIVLFAIPVIIGTRQQTWYTIKLVFSKFKNFLALGGSLGFILVFPLVLWHIQTGEWIVMSYGNETFDFLNPQFSQVLFGYRKGWIVYTPLILLCFYGIYRIWRANKFRAGSLILFIVIAVWVTSSWWCWYYGMSFGQRPLIEFYPILALPLALVLTQNRVVVSGLIILCVCFNLWRSYQHQNGILPTDEVTSAVFWKTMFSTEPYQKPLYNPNLWTIDKEMHFDFESGEQTTIENARSGNRSIFANKKSEFSYAITQNLLVAKTERKLLISGWVTTENADDVDLVIDVSNDSGLLFYQAYNLPATTDWREISKLVDIPENAGILKVYLWNSNKKGKAYLDDLSIQILLLK